VQNPFLKENLCALQVLLCALISRPVCTRAQLEGTLLVALGAEFYCLIRAYISFDSGVCVLACVCVCARGYVHRCLCGCV